MSQLMRASREVEVLSAVEHIAAFAASARPKHLRSDIRQLFKRNILDSLGCAIAGLQGRPFQALREQLEEYRAPGRCTLIGGGKTSADQAALFNSSLVRYVDLLDSYMALGGLCHPSDNFGTVLAAAEQAGASGEEFMLALAVAYEIQCRFSAAVPVMAKGFNHATQLAISAAASAGKLLGLSAVEIVTQTVLKKYCSLIHGQPVLEAVLDLKRRNNLMAANVEAMRCDVFQGAFDFAGGRARPIAAGTHSGAGCAGAACKSGRPPRRAVHRSVSQRAQCPNHDPYQRPADSHERASGLRRRSDQSYVMGPDRGEISMAERTVRR